MLGCREGGGGEEKQRLMGGRAGRRPYLSCPVLAGEVLAVPRRPRRREAWLQRSADGSTGYVYYYRVYRNRRLSLLSPLEALCYLMCLYIHTQDIWTPSGDPCMPPVLAGSEGFHHRPDDARRGVLRYRPASDAWKLRLPRCDGSRCLLEGQAGQRSSRPGTFCSTTSQLSPCNVPEAKGLCWPYFR